MINTPQSRFSTTRLIVWDFLIALLAIMLLYVAASQNTHNHFALVVFVLSYLAMWVLAVISPFRPYSHFTLKGHPEIRLVNTIGAVGSIAFLWALNYFVLLLAN